MKMTLPSKRVLSTLNAALVVGVAISALFLVKDVLTAVLSPAPEGKAAVRTAPSIGQGRETLAQYAPVLDNSVFGFPGGRLRPLYASAAKPARGPSVDVTLRGTVASEEGTGYAVVEDSAGLQSVYATGELIMGAGTLKRVERDRIYVEDDGGEKVFELADLIRIEDMQRRRADMPSAGNRMKPADFVKQTADRSFVVDYDAVRAALENPQQIMTDARLLPNTVDGGQKGFVISEIRQGGVYDALGLQNGDVLVRVNDFTISDPQTALQAFTALKGMEKINLDIERDGKSLTLTYDLR